jgi:hypothetical protein
MTSPFQNYKLTTHPDRSKIQNAVDYAIKSSPSSSKTRTNTPPRSSSPKTQTSQFSSTNLPLSKRFPNKFTNLSEFPPLPSKLPTYAQTVTASSLKSQTQPRSNDSSSNSQSQASSPSQINLFQSFPSPHSAESLQVIKSLEVNIFLVEQQIAYIQNPRQVISQMFPSGWYFQPEHPYKTQLFMNSF